MVDPPTLLSMLLPPLRAKCRFARLLTLPLPLSLQLPSRSNDSVLVQLWHHQRLGRLHPCALCKLHTVADGTQWRPRVGAIEHTYISILVNPRTTKPRLCLYNRRPSVERMEHLPNRKCSRDEDETQLHESMTEPTSWYTVVQKWRNIANVLSCSGCVVVYTRPTSHT